MVGGSDIVFRLFATEESNTKSNPPNLALVMVQMVMAMVVMAMNGDDVDDNDGGESEEIQRDVKVRSKPKML